MFVFQKFLLLSLVALLALTGCASRPSNDLAGQGGLRERIDVGRHQIPLPEGEWRLVAYQLYRSAEGLPYVDLQLLNIDEQALELRAGVLISANLVTSGRPFRERAVGVCEQPGYFRGGGLEQGSGGKDCWLVGYFRTVLGASSGRVAAITLDYLQQHRIPVPSVALFSVYRLSSERDDLTVHYYFNPEYGRRFESAYDASWQASPWHPRNYLSDPDKVAYVEELKVWGADWYERVKLGFAVN